MSTGSPRGGKGPAANPGIREYPYQHPARRRPGAAGAGDGAPFLDFIARSYSRWGQLPDPGEAGRSSTPGSTHSTANAFAPGDPRTWTGDIGLLIPAAAARFKIYSMTAEGNERGSNAVMVTRPLEP